MNDAFDTSEQYDSREDYLETWRMTERFFERIGGVLFIFCGGLLLAFEQRGDAIALLAAPALMAVGATLIMRRRRVALVHIHLRLLKAAQQANRALMLGLGGAALMFLAFNSGSFTPALLGALASVTGVFYQWRVRKIKQYDALFKKRDAGRSDEDTPSGED